MKHPVLHNRWDKIITTIVLLLIGIVLALVHFLLVLLPLNNLIEALLFGGFGYLFGKKVAGGNPLWGIILALPAMLLLIYRIKSVQAAENAVKPFVTMLLLPLFACAGMYLRLRFHPHKHFLIDKHFLND